jgi:hypothetical protein
MPELLFASENTMKMNDFEGTIALKNRVMEGSKEK